MPKPFANTQQYLNNISDDFIVPIQTGNATDDAGLPQMKYVKFSQLNNYIRSNLSTLGTFRGACTTEVPDNLAVNDFFYCKTSFTSGDDSFVAGHYYQYDINGNWVEITLAFDGLLTEADVIDNLTTQASDKPLSAKQGKVLNDAISDISDDVTALTTRVSNIEETLMGENEITLQYPNDSTYPSLMPNRVPLRSLKFAEVPTIVGKTRAWNQLIDHVVGSGNGVFTYDGSMTYSDGAFHVTSDNIYTRFGFKNQTFLGGHRYLFVYSAKKTSGEGVIRYYTGTEWTNTIPLSASWQTITWFWDVSTTFTMTNGDNPFWCSASDGTLLADAKVLCRDLTLIFGSGNEPSTVAEALAQLPDLAKYDAYDAGSLVSTEVSGVKSVGVNLWDEVKNEGKTIGDTGTAIIMYASSGSFCPTNQIPCKPNTTYKFIYSNPQSVTKPWLFELASEGTDSWSGFTIAQYVDSGYSFTTSANAKYITFACFDGITNIQLCDNSLPDAIKTTYHPYKTDTLSLPSTVTLKSAGSVHDELDVESGVITRKVGSYTFTGSETWDKRVGTNTVYYLQITGMIINSNSGVIPNLICDSYATARNNSLANLADSLNNKEITVVKGNNFIVVRDDTLTDSTVASSMQGKTILYELATPTTESIDPVPYNFLEVEGGGTVDNIQEQNPVIDNCLDVTYDIIPQ